MRASAVVMTLALLLSACTPSDAEPEAEVNQPTNTKSSPAASPARAGPGNRWVGMGHAVIAVPKRWANNATRCGTPQQDTVITQMHQIDTCIDTAPRGVSAVLVEFIDGLTKPTTLARMEAIQIDGHDAYGLPVACGSYQPRCQGAVSIPSVHAAFVVMAPTKAEVEARLATVRVLPDRVAVPETRYAEGLKSTDYRRFLDWAQALGLKVDLQPRAFHNFSPGMIAGVHPSVASVVKVGATVRLDVVPRIPDQASCRTLRVDLVAGRRVARVYPQLKDAGHSRLVVKPGEKVQLSASGPCGEHVYTDLEHDLGVLPPAPDSTFKARRPGQTNVTFYMPFCSTLNQTALATCLAGRATLGQVAVTVSR